MMVLWKGGGGLMLVSAVWASQAAPPRGSLPALTSGSPTTEYPMSGGILDFTTPNVPLEEDLNATQEAIWFGGSIKNYLQKLKENQDDQRENFAPLARRRYREREEFKLMDSDPKRFANYAGLVYCDRAELRRWDCALCSTIGNKTRTYSVIEFPNEEARAAVMISQPTRELVVSIRGTYNLDNWLANLKFFRTEFGGISHAAVHIGFKDIADRLQPGIHNSLSALLKRKEYRDFKIVFVGHSLGGAVATLSTVYTQQTLDLSWDRFKVITYGQPRVGNLEFALWYNNLPLEYIRVVNENDIVAHVPPRYIGYHHVKNEMYIVNGISITCLASYTESETCSNDRVPYLSIEPHRSAWGVPLGELSC